MNPLDREIMRTLRDIDPSDVALGFLRYRYLRKCTAEQLKDLRKKSLRGGSIDDLIDAALEDELTKTKG